MKFTLIVFAMLMAVATSRADTAGAADPVAQGKELVGQKKCSICHAVDGKGGKMGKPMNGIAEGKTDEFLLGALTDPKKTIGADTKMPSYKEKLKDEELKAVIAYLKSLKK